jgi:hypothetical protein
VSAASPRWLRLVRDGDTITGYDSAAGTHWTPAGTAALPGLTSTVQAGLIAAALAVAVGTAARRSATAVAAAIVVIFPVCARPGLVGLGIQDAGQDPGDEGDGDTEQAS